MIESNNSFGTFFVPSLKAEEQSLYKALYSITTCPMQFGKYIWKKNSPQDLGLLERVEEGVLGGLFASWWSGEEGVCDLQEIKKVLDAANRRFGSEALERKREELQKRFEHLQGLKEEKFEQEAALFEDDLDELISYIELFYPSNSFEKKDASSSFSLRGERDSQKEPESKIPASQIDRKLELLKAACRANGKEEIFTLDKTLNCSIYRNRKPLIDLKEALRRQREEREERRGYLIGLCKGVDLLKKSGIELEKPLWEALLSLSKQEKASLSLESIEKRVTELTESFAREVDSLENLEEGLESKQELMAKLSEQVLFLKLLLSEVTTRNPLSALLLQAEALLKILESLHRLSDRSLSYQRELLLDRMEKELSHLNESNLKRRLSEKLEAGRRESLKTLLEPYFSKALNKNLILEKAVRTLKKIEEASKEFLKSDKKVLKLGRDEKSYACMLFKEASGKQVKSSYILFKKHDGLKALGKGAFSSSITLAYDVQSRKMRVMKSVGPKIQSWGQYCDLFKAYEIKGFEAAQGVKGLIQLFDWAEYSSHKEAGTKIAYFVELFKGGSCKSLLKKKNFLTRDEKRALIGELLEALANLQKRGLALRDIKPDNILMKREKGKAKLADLGFFYSRNGTGVPKISGTPQYFPPEYFLSGGKIPINYKTFEKHDSWSLGAALYQLWFEKEPIWFRAKDFRELALCFTDSKFAAVKQPKEENSIEHIIYKLLQKDPAHRWSGEEAFRHFQALEKSC